MVEIEKTNTYIHNIYPKYWIELRLRIFTTSQKYKICSEVYLYMRNWIKSNKIAEIKHTRAAWMVCVSSSSSYSVVVSCRVLTFSFFFGFMFCFVLFWRKFACWIMNYIESTFFWKHFFLLQFLNDFFFSSIFWL